MAIKQVSRSVLQSNILLLYVVIMALFVGVFVGFGGGKIAIVFATIPFALIVFMKLDPFVFLGWVILSWPFLRFYIWIRLGAGIPDLTYIRMCLLVLFGLMLRDFVTHKLRMLPLELPDVLILLFCVVQFFTYLRGAGYSGGVSTAIQQYATQVLEPIVLYILARQLIRTEQQLSIILRIVILMCVLVALVGFYERSAKLEDTLFLISDRQYRDHGGTRYLEVAGGRLGSAFINPAATGIALISGFMAMYAIGRRFNKGWQQALVLGTLGFLVVSIFYTLTRSVWLSFVFVLLVVQFFGIKTWRWLIPTLVLIGILGLTFWSLISTLDVFANRILEGNHGPRRIAMFVGSLKLIMIHPIFGNGTGMLDTFLQPRYGLISHNTFMTYLIDGGLVTLGLFASMVSITVLRALAVLAQSKTAPYTRKLIAFAVGTMAIFLPSGLLFELRWFPYIWFLFWLACASINMLYRKQQEQKLKSA